MTWNSVEPGSAGQDGQELRLPEAWEEPLLALPKAVPADTIATAAWKQITPFLHLACFGSRILGGSVRLAQQKSAAQVHADRTVSRMVTLAHFLLR